MDTPSDAAVTPKEGIQLKEGDVVVLSTDGFGDNVFGEELEQLCKLVHEKCIETQSQSPQSESPTATTATTVEGVVELDDHLFASSLAQTSLNFARLVMFKKDKVTPFEVEARRYGYGKGSGLGGGKVDDVTVVVAVVGKTRA
jgi:protein phosphatase PTC7